MKPPNDLKIKNKLQGQHVGNLGLYWTFNDSQSTSPPPPHTQYPFPYQGCFIRKYKAAIWIATVTKTCKTSGVTLLADVKLPIGRWETSLAAGPVWPISTAMLVVMNRSMYRNCTFPRMLVHWTRKHTFLYISTAWYSAKLNNKHKLQLNITGHKRQTWWC
jgi:hypothetical protein